LERDLCALSSDMRVLCRWAQLWVKVVITDSKALNQSLPRRLTGRAAGNLPAGGCSLSLQDSHPWLHVSSRTVTKIFVLPKTCTDTCSQLGPPLGRRERRRVRCTVVSARYWSSAAQSFSGEIPAGLVAMFSVYQIWEPLIISPFRDLALHRGATVFIRRNATTYPEDTPPTPKSVVARHEPRYWL
jgi:hypothetical protein